MNDIEKALIEKASELLTSGAVSRVVGWKKGEFSHGPRPPPF